MDLGVMTRQQVADALGIKVRTLDDMRYKGEGPEHFLIRNKLIRYRKADVMQWIDEQGEK